MKCTLIRLCPLHIYYTYSITQHHYTLLWTTIDQWHRIYSFIEHPGYIEIETTCHSNYENVWLALLLACLFLLSAAVVIVAVKSRKIRLTRFKDTKKVNLLIFLLYIVGICTFSYWKILSDAGFVIPSVIILYVEHMLTAFLCQTILFVPKIWPALHKKANANDCMCKGHIM